MTFRGAGKTITVREDEVVLDAACEQGLAPRVGCAFGECGACIVDLVEGEVAPYEARGITDREKANGRLLLCRARARSDLVVDERGRGESRSIAR